MLKTAKQHRIRGKEQGSTVGYIDKHNAYTGKNPTD
jgi:hypothetical protein